MREAHWLLGAVVQHNPMFAGDIEQQLIARGGDPKLSRILELSGVPDLARAAWISPVSDRGVVSWPVAQIGEVTLAQVERTIESVNAVPGLFSDFHLPFLAPDQVDCIICPVGDRTVGRAALFLHQRPWSSSFRAQLDEAIERVRQLIHMVWIIRGEVLDDVDPTRPAEELAEHCPFGVLILDADQHVHLANGPVRKLLAQSKAIGLMGNRMVIDQSTDAIRFQVALRAVLMQARESQSGERRVKAIAIDGGGNAPLLMSISNLPAGSGGAARACVIVTRPDAQAEAEIAPLAEHFSLTPVEVRVVRELVKGLSVQDIALTLQLKVQTVRTYLKQIFQKTGTHRQAELMQLMLNGALPVLD